MSDFRFGGIHSAELYENENWTTHRKMKIGTILNMVLQKSIDSKWTAKVRNEEILEMLKEKKKIYGEASLRVKTHLWDKS